MKSSCLVFYILSLAMVISCKKADHVVDSPSQGTITVGVDESFQSVTEALTSRYMALYPGTEIKLSVKKEDLAFIDLLSNKARVVVMSRELTAQERQAYKREVDLDWLPAKFAADAVLFIVPKNSPLNEISINEIKDELMSNDKRMIFDGTNSSNLNFVAQKLNTTPDKLKFSIINGNKNLAENLDRFPGKIGVISLNTLSRPYDPDAEALRNSIKILNVVDKKRSFGPSVQNLRNGTYPFTRILYFLTNEKYFGLGNGLIRFSCTQLGQIVVSKEGLQPYNIFKREVQMR